MVSAFGRKGTLEVNPVDLIAIECMRVFEPGIYAALQENKSLLTEHELNYGDAAKAKERLKTSVEKLLKAALGKPENTKYILTILFPKLESIWGNMFYGNEYNRVWTRQRRICSPDFFDRFFILRIPTGQVSESVIQAILESCEDRTALQNIFAKLEHDNLLLPTIERLQAEESLDKLKKPLPYLLALADISDQLPPSRKISTLATPGSILVRWAVMGTLKTRKTSDEKISIIRSLICDSQSISLAGEWIDDVTEPKEGSSYPKIEGAALDELKNNWLKKAREAAKDGRLLGVAELNWVLPRWMKWTDPSEAKEWVSSLFTNPKKLLIFLKAYTNEARSQTIGSYYAHDKGWLSWKSCLAVFSPRDKWEQIANELSKIADLSDDEKRTVRLFGAAMKRWQSGVEDDNPRKFEDVELETNKNTE
jgi:predicted KAP-like P-loop ATPase